MINIGFRSKKQEITDPNRLPPGQYITHDFPVLSLGPTPRVDPAQWQMKMRGLCTPASFTYADLLAMPASNTLCDIHCVTKWSKYDTKWVGVSMDYILDKYEVKPEATHLIASSADTYSTNIPLADIRDGKAWLAYQYDGEDLTPMHGGPVRLLIPHLYFWKSAKWVEELNFTDHDVKGFWEERGYHNYGDPWKEERYS